MFNKKYLRILAAAMALLPVLAGCGSEEEKPENTQPAALQEVADKQTIYVRSAARTYSGAGEVVELKTWEYNDRGMMLSYEMDAGTAEPVWDEQLMTYVINEDSVWTPIDGAADSYQKYEYDAQGNMSRLQYKWSADMAEQVYECLWEYEDGLPLSMVSQDVSNGEMADTKYEFTHDEAGNLTHIAYFKTTGEKHYAYKMAYDDQGRMTRLIKCQMEYDVIYDFTYNEQGFVAEYCYCTNAPNSGDTEDVTGIKAEDSWPQVYNPIYTQDGQLQSLHGVDYQYEDGKLVAQIAGDLKWEFRYDGTTPVDLSGERTYDENGCLVKVINQDGTYTEYEYKKLSLSEKDVQRHYNQQQSWLEPTSTNWIRLSYLDPVTSAIIVPTEPSITVSPVVEYYK